MFGPSNAGLFKTHVAKMKIRKLKIVVSCPKRKNRITKFCHSKSNVNVRIGCVIVAGCWNFTKPQLLAREKKEVILDSLKFDGWTKSETYSLKWWLKWWFTIVESVKKVIFKKSKSCMDGCCKILSSQVIHVWVKLFSGAVYGKTWPRIPVWFCQGYIYYNCRWISEPEKKQYYPWRWRRWDGKWMFGRLHAWNSNIHTQNTRMWKEIASLKLTWPPKINGWKMNFLLGWPIFRGYVSFREGTCSKEWFLVSMLIFGGVTARFDCCNTY